MDWEISGKSKKRFISKSVDEIQRFQGDNHTFTIDFHQL